MKKNQNNSILVCYIFLQKKEEYFFGEMFNPRDVQELYQIKLEQISGWFYCPLNIASSFCFFDHFLTF